MTAVLLIAGVISAVIILACCKVSGDSARKEEQEDGH